MEPLSVSRALSRQFLSLVGEEGMAGQPMLHVFKLARHHSGVDMDEGDIPPLEGKEK